MAGEVFISYRRADEARARQLYNLLRAEGVEAWYDAHVGAGEDWRKATATALDHSKIFVLLFSRAASESDDIAKELAAATFSKKLVVPVRIENIQPTGSFLYELASRNWINAYDDTDAKLGELAKSLAVLVRSGKTDDRATLPFDRAAGGRTGRRRHLALAGLAVAAAAIGLAAYATLGSGSGHEPPPQRVAFFGFAPQGGDPQLAALAAGATDKTFQALEALRIDTSARAETVDAHPANRLEAAGKLGALYALSGVTSQAGDQVVMAIRLDDVPRRTTLFEDTVRIEAAAAQGLPAQAATRASSWLGCIIRYRASLPREDADAVALLPGACRPDGMDIDLWRKLVKQAPESAVIQAGFAYNLWYALRDAPEATQRSMLPEADHAAATALRLDPKLPDAYTAAYNVARWRVAPLVEQEKILQDGLALAPNDAALNLWYGNHLRFVGRISESIPVAQQSVMTTQVSYSMQAGYNPVIYAGSLGMAGRKQESSRVFREAFQTTPFATGWREWLEASIYSGVDDPETVLALSPPATRVVGVAPLASVSVFAGETDCWRDIAAGLAKTDAASRARGARAIAECQARGSFSPTRTMTALAHLGDLNGAFERANAMSLPAVMPYGYWPRLTAFRADPRFEPLARQLGLMDYWKTTGRLPDFCASEQAPVCATLRSN